MPIFISYSHQDKLFVDSLAKMLVLAKHHVWMDRWELKLGDSLTSKIQESLTTSSAILVILSKNSVESEWCKRELNAGLVRELEEKNTIVMPIVIDDCKIPLFIRDKLYANFNVDPDEAFNLIDTSLAKISNPTTSRVEHPTFNTDFALDWRNKPADDFDDEWIIRWTFIDHGEKMSHTLISECQVYADEESEKHFLGIQTEQDKIAFAQSILKILVEKTIEKPLTEKIEDNFAKFVAFKISYSVYNFFIKYTYRRLGPDNGMDTVVYLDNNLKMALTYLDSVLQKNEMA